MSSIPDGTQSTASAPDVTFDVQETVMDNGLRLLVLEDHSAPVISYQVHYAAGSRNERPGITGISHLFEHMMFKGTASTAPEEFARTIQAHGGQVNAFTTEDNTTYYENLPADRLDLAIRLEADRQASLRLSKENLDSEREVVRNERLLRTVNTPYGLPRDQLRSLAFERHPYRWPVVGWDSDLVAMTVADCQAYFRTYYAASNTTVVVAGACRFDTVLEKVQEAYGPLPARDVPPPVVTLEEPQHGERRAVYRKEVEAAAFFAGFHIPGLTHADTLPLLVLSSILSSGESSRLYRRFVKPGRAGAVKTDVGLSFLNRDATLFRVDAVANPGDAGEPLEHEVWNEVDRIAREGVEDREVKRACKQLLASFIMQAQTNFYRGLQLGILQVRAGDWRWIRKLVPGYRAVTAADVRRVASSYLRADNRSVVVVIPVAASG